MPDFIYPLVFLLWFVGGFVSGVSGIGGAMVAVPVAAMFLPIHDVIAICCITNVVMDGCIALMHFRYCRVSAVVPMLIGSVPGAFAGLYLLQTLSGSFLQGAVGVLLLYYVYWQHTFRVARPHKESWPVGGTAGFGAGLLGTAISFDGPPVAAYGLYAGWEPRVFLGTLGVFFVIRSLLTCVLQAGAGFYTPDVIHCVMFTVPAVILGTLCSFPVVKRIKVDVFKKVLLAVIVGGGLVCLGRVFL